VVKRDLKRDHMKPLKFQKAYYSEPKILPKKWDTGGKALLSEDWRIEYRYYDPAFHDQYPPPGKRIRVKGFMNREKTLEARRETARALLKNELDLLMNQGYNPISGTINPPQPTAHLEPVYPEMPFVDALAEAVRLKAAKGQTKSDLESVLRWTTAAIKNLELGNIPIKDVRRKTVKVMLDEIGRLKGDKWTPNNYNYYKSYLSMIWFELLEYEAVECNVVRDIAKKPTVLKLREVLTDEERIKINNTLRERNFRYWVYINIFFHFGARNTELLRLKGKDVNLVYQNYKVLIKKGKQWTETLKPIKDVAMYFWNIAMQGCGLEDYVFGAKYLPGCVPTYPKTPTDHWKKLVKVGLGIDKDLYSLKHLNTEEITELLSLEDAAKLNGHTTTKMTEKHYAVGHKARQNERLKKVGNTFSSEV
jgi:integrase